MCNPSAQLSSAADLPQELLGFVTNVLVRNSVREGDIPESLRGLKGIEDLHALLWDIRHLTYALGKGDLKYVCKGKGCVIGALKTLQANLCHLTWQAQCIARGEYQHRVNFMGDFSTAFNQMVVELDKNVSELMRLSQKYKRLSSRDSLTGMYNRRAFQNLVVDALGGGGQSELPSTIIMADIDHFKKVNDTYGHACGDVVLRAFAQKMSSLLRSHDLLCRYGGEEFVILLPGAALEVGAVVAQRLCRGAQGMTLHCEGLDLRITASFGVSSLAVPQPQSRKEIMEALDSAVKRADDCLYQAKNAGRNTVVCEDANAPAA